ncbi:MAG TPA: hypothetical protein PKI92_01145 [Candidatus Woesebacteria bacterium]|nr:hypothetical protein [Candidatus Woesebacteria bacterium]HOY61513.1 hypothetical protein [Candidatus Woesebacteria bacterium]HPR99385.1 hypothetical protein [Candidatus Woesebacteria bacterium]
MSKEIYKSNIENKLIKIEKRASELQRDRDFIDGNPKKFLKTLLSIVDLKNEADPEKYTSPYILSPSFDETFLVLERKLMSGTKPYNEETKDHSTSDYKYIEVVALGYIENEDGSVEVGFFKKNEKDPYIYNHPEKIDFTPLDAGMLFTITVSKEQIISTLALAFASYEYNKGKPLNNQVAFPSES